MYQQSAFFAEAPTLFILLAGLILLYRSFREKYLVPWITGWILYIGAKFFLALNFAPFFAPVMWATIAYICFAAAVGCLCIAVFQYVYQPRFIFPAISSISIAALLGVAKALWPGHSQAFAIAFSVFSLMVVYTAVLQLLLFARGRRIAGLWLMAAMLLALHLDSRPVQHYFHQYDIAVDLLLGLSMIMIVLDDSRVQIQRSAVLNKLDRVISDSDDFAPVIETAMEELLPITGARAAWFRTLENGRMRLEAARGVPSSFVDRIRDMDAASSTGMELLRAGEVGVVPAESAQPEMKALIREQKINHLLIVPVIGKSSRIGVFVLAMRRARSYTKNDRLFLKMVATQLGLAAENRGLLQQLVSSKNEWVGTFNSIPDYILVHDSQNRILRLNRALLNRLNRSYTSVVLQPCEAVLPANGASWKGCPYCSPPALGREHDPCFGGYSVVSSSSYSGHDSEGGMVHVIKDVTDIRIAEERYKALFDHMQEGVFVSSPQGKILDCNDAFVKMFGYSSKDELLELDAAQVLYIDPEDRRKFLEEMARHGFVRKFEYSLRHKDGRRVAVVESSFATRDPATGAIERYQGVILDVTEQKRAQDEIRRRNRELYVLNSIAVTFNQSFSLDEILHLTLLQLAELFSSDTAMVYLFDAAASTMRRKAYYGYGMAETPENESFVLPAEFLESLRSKHAEIIGPLDLPYLPGSMRSCIQPPGFHSGMWVVLWSEEKIIGLLGVNSRTAHEFNPSDESVMIAVARQLATTIHKIQLYHETRKAYEDLRRTQEQLLQSEKMSAVGQLVSGVAHELNNPLTAIMGYTQLLETEKTEAPVQEFIQKLYKQAFRAHKIVQNLLSFARQHKPQRTYVDVRNVMEETIALRDYELKAHHIVVERDFASELPSVMADPHQLEQVFLNIINNAADAMLENSNGGVLRIRIYSDDGQVVTEMRDSGPGMADPKRVFDPFYTTKGVGKGTGLGLSICYGIVKEHGGEISASNQVQGGALLRVSLPVAAGRKPMTESERIAIRRSDSLLKGRALVIDGGLGTLRTECEVLNAAGLEVVVLAAHKSAIEKLKQEQFDAIFIESKVAGIESSEQLLRWIQDSQRELAAKTVLVVCDVADPGVDVFTVATKILCLVRPYEVSDLLAIVRRILRPSRASVQAAH